MRDPGASAAVFAVMMSMMAAGNARGADRPLGLEEAIGLALRHSDTIIIRREAAAASDAAAGGARGAYDPLLEVSAGWSRTTEPVNSAFSGAPSGELAPTVEAGRTGLVVSQLLPTGGAVSLRAAASRETTDGAFTLLSPAYGTRVGLELRQPLLRDLAIDPARLGMQLADAGNMEAMAALEGTVNDTIAAVTRSYWNLVAARREVIVRREAIRLAEEQLEETITRVEGGAAPRTDEAQPRAEIERRRGELFESIESVSRAENLVKLLILTDADGAAWLEGIEPTESLETAGVEPDIAAEMERALLLRPEVAAAAAFLERRRAESRFASNDVRPALDAVVSYDRFGLSGFENPDGGSIPGVPALIPSELEGGWSRSWATLGEGHFDDTRLGLVFGIPLGNRTARAAAAGARNAERGAEAELARIRKVIRVEVLDAGAALQTAAQRIEAARAALESAEVQLFAEQERFAVGLSTNFLVLTRQNDLSGARLEEIESLADYRTALSQMERATGSLLQGRDTDPAAAAGEEPSK